MAELAIGTISLGIQVCQGIAAYVDALSSRDEETRAITKQAEGLENILRSIESSVNCLGSTTKLSAPGIIQCLQTCETEVHTLDKIGRELIGRPLSSILSLRGKVKEGYELLKYPAARPGIIRLRDQLSRSIDSLQLATQSLDLDLSVEINNTTSSIERILQSDVIGRLSEIEAHIPSLYDQRDANFTQIRVTHAASQEANATTHQKLDELRAILQHRALLPITASGAGGVRETQMAMHLAAKPALLQSLCDQRSSDSESTLEPPQLSISGSTRVKTIQVCICPRHRVREHQRSTWGPFHFYKTSSVFRHTSECPLSEYTPTNEQYVQGMIFAGVPLKYLRRAIELSFSMSRGAGGYSISPCFTMYHTVDAQRSPTFRILHDLCNCLEATGYRGPAEDVKAQWQLLIHHAMNKIIHLFRHQKASPFDVDEDNQSLLHLAASLVSVIMKYKERPTKILERTNMIPTITLKAFAAHEYPKNWWYKEEANVLTSAAVELARCLVAYGVPLELSNTRGEQAIHMAFAQHTADFIAEAFHPADLEVQRVIEGGGEAVPMDPDELGTYLRFYQTWPAVAEAFYGPLTVAVLRNDSMEVERIIHRNVSALLERNLYGHTPFHMAVDNPGCLRILVQRSTPNLLGQADRYGTTIIGYSILISRQLCISETDQDSYTCPCTEPFRILVDGGCPLMPPSDFCGGYELFQYGSDHVKAEVAKALRDNREALKALALEKLSSFDAQALDLGPGTLDVRAAKVYRTLIQRQVHVPANLEVFLPKESAEIPSGDQYSRSVYYDIGTVNDAEFFFNMGFCDVDNNTQPQSWERLDNRISDPPTLPSLQYTAWLASHGRQLRRWSPSLMESWKREATNTFFIAGTVGERLFRWQGPLIDIHHAHEQSERNDKAIEMEAAHSLHEIICSADEYDSCHCRCSINGCSPFALMLKRMSLAQTRTLVYSTTHTHFATYLEYFGGYMERRHHQAALRLHTFEALDIRHTCEERNSTAHFFVKKLNREEIDAIQEEDSEKINKLEELLEEFEEYTLGNHEGDELALEDMVQFWRGYWVQRMQQEIDEMERLNDWDKEKRATEAMGVVWKMTKSYKEKEAVERNWDYWIRRIEEIE